MTATVDTTLDRIGRWMAARLRRETSGYEPYTPSDPETLRAVLKPGDVLLVEGHQYISMVIEYLTMSSWSHAAIFVGDIPGRAEANGEPHVLVEVNLGEGCVSAPLSRYTTFNTRVCRPLMLTYDDQLRIVRFMVERIGLRYDMRNFFDLLRYFVPAAPAADITAARHRLRLRRPDPRHLLLADRRGVPGGRLSDPAARRLLGRRRSEEPAHAP